MKTLKRTFHAKKNMRKGVIRSLKKVHSKGADLKDLLEDEKTRGKKNLEY